MSEKLRREMRKAGVLKHDPDFGLDVPMCPKCGGWEWNDGSQFSPVCCCQWGLEPQWAGVMGPSWRGPAYRHRLEYPEFAGKAEEALAKAAENLKNLAAWEARQK